VGGAFVLHFSTILAYSVLLLFSEPCVCWLFCVALEEAWLIENASCCFVWCFCVSAFRFFILLIIQQGSFYMTGFMML
jgi:hypothetical protein